MTTIITPKRTRSEKPRCAIAYCRADPWVTISAKHADARIAGKCLCEAHYGDYLKDRASQWVAQHPGYKMREDGIIIHAMNDDEQHKIECRELPPRSCERCDD